MRVLISGGTGLVGRSLVQSLTENGHHCSVLTRDPDQPSVLPASVTMHRWDASSVEPLVAWVETADAIVHLSGEGIGDGRWSAIRKQRILESRVESTRALSAAVQQAEKPPAVFVQASAVGYYGPRGDEEVTEDSAPGDDFLAQVCRDWESASDEVEAAGVRRAVVRTGIVLAKDGGALPRMALPFKLFAGGPAGSGRQWMPWIHLADEVGALRFVLENANAKGPLNLAAPNPVTNRQFSTELGRALKRPSFMPAPAFALRLALGEMADLILTGQRAIPRRLLDLGYTFRFPHLPAALNDLYP